MATAASICSGDIIVVRVYPRCLAGASQQAPYGTRTATALPSPRKVGPDTVVSVWCFHTSSERGLPGPDLSRSNSSHRADGMARVPRRPFPASWGLLLATRVAARRHIEGARVPRRLRSAEDCLHHLAVHVGQAEVAARVAIGEAGVLEAEQLQDGGVEVPDRNRVFHDIATVVVRLPVDDAALDAAASQP